MNWFQYTQQEPQPPLLQLPQMQQQQQQQQQQFPQYIFKQNLPPPQQQQQQQEDDYFLVIERHTKYRDSDEGKLQRSNALLSFFVERMGYHGAHLGSSKESRTLVVIPVPEEGSRGGRDQPELKVACGICKNKPKPLSNFFRHMRSNHLIDFRSESACNNKASLNFVRQRFPRLVVMATQESPYASFDSTSPQTIIDNTIPSPFSDPTTASLSTGRPVVVSSMYSRDQAPINLFSNMYSNPPPLYQYSGHPQIPQPQQMFVVVQSPQGYISQPLQPPLQGYVEQQLPILPPSSQQQQQQQQQQQPSE